jgi:microcystin degradation protein MlrC
MMAARRIAIGRLWQETNTFSEVRTTLDDFRRYTLCFGPEVLDIARAQADEIAQAEPFSRPR